MFIFMLMILTISSTNYSHVEAFGFQSNYPYQVKSNISLISKPEFGAEKRHENTNKGRMFGIDTGNSDTDQEAGMWLFALLGTLAAAVPVAFLSPNLGFKKRSLNSNLLEDTFEDDFNHTIKINSSITNSFRLLKY